MNYRRKQTHSQKITDAFSSLTSAKTVPVLFLLLIIVALPVTVLLARQQQSLEQHAAGTASFITRSGSTLLFNGSPFRFAGTNIPWLGLDEQNGGSVGGVHYPTKYNIDDALDTAKEMGATVVRSHSLGISTGCATYTSPNTLCLEPTLNNFNDQAFNTIDYAIYAAGQRGIKLIIPLTDGNTPCYYNGCRRDFVDWVYPGSTSDDLFFTDATVVNDFEAYISHLLNHVNQYTGIALKDDPTIMAWESGNELDEDTSITTTWLTTISQYIKSLDANHLVMDGGWTMDSGRLSIPTVDMYTRHYYYGGWLYGGTPISDYNYYGCLAVAAQKVYTIGEYEWTEQRPSTTSPFLQLSTFLPNVETYKCPGTTNYAGAGDIFWQLFPHKDSSGFEHGDQFTLNYTGNTSLMRTQAQSLRSHAYTMSGLSVPSAAATTRAPLLRTPKVISGGVQLSWQGVATAAYYQIERSTDNGFTWIVVSPGSSPTDGTVGGLTDNDDATSAWTDTGGTNTSLYRIRAFNLNNVAGPYSISYNDTVSTSPTPALTLTPTPTTISAATNTPILTPTPTLSPTQFPTPTPTPKKKHGH